MARDEDEPRNFRHQFRNIIQNISSVLVPLILVSNVEISRLIMAVFPSIVSILFLLYDYYREHYMGCLDNNTGKYVIWIKNKKELNDYNVNQLYKDIEFYINENVMKKGVKTSVVDESHRLKYHGNGYYNYQYNIKIPDNDSVFFKFKGYNMKIQKTVLQSDSSEKIFIMGLKIVAPNFKVGADFLKTCQQTYKDYLDNLEKVTYHFYRYNKDSKKWENNKINTIKNFQNIILPEGTEGSIKQWLDEFQKSRDRYKYLGIPYKLSFLFHGQPGCGKTSLSYCLAQELDRNIYQIPLDSCTNGNELKAIVKTIPEGNIIIFEEIDTCPFLTKRDNNNMSELKKIYNKTMKKKNNFEDIGDEDEDEDEVYNSETDEYESPTNKKETKINYKESKEDIGFKKIMKTYDQNMKTPEDMVSSYMNSQLSHVLEILDGYNYLYDSIVILYTNHLEKIDPAVVRPGRVDHIIELFPPNEYQVQKLYQLFYNKDINKDDCQKIVDRGITTSFLMNTCMVPYINDMEKSIESALTIPVHT